MTKDERELLRRARMGFVPHLCTDGVPHGAEQDPTITCLACDIDKVLRATHEPKENLAKLAGLNPRTMQPDEELQCFKPPNEVD